MGGNGQLRQDGQTFSSVSCNPGTLIASGVSCVCVCVHGTGGVCGG